MNKSRIALAGVTAALGFGLMGWGAVAAGEEIMGVVTTEEGAGIAAAEQIGSTRSVTIDMVRAPKDSWVVVHQNDGGMPGERLGYAAVKKGVTRNVKVKLDPDVPLTPELLAAVHVDGGIKGTLEFDMEDMERSTDKPYFVNGAEVAVAFGVAEFGVPVEMDGATIQAGDQGIGPKVTIASAMAPTDAFVVVHKATADGMPGERVGYAAIKAGETKNIEVKLTEKLTGRTKLLAAIHADRGVAGKLEFDMEAPVDSPDQPFFADGMEVATAFEVGTWGVPVDEASIKVADQIGVTDRLVVDRVVAPSDGWIVVHLDAGGAPGERVGLKRVEAGETVDVDVELTSDKLTEKLFVAVHADRGQPEVFDFDMMDKLGSPDQPFFVDGEEVAVAAKVREFGVATPAGTAAVAAMEQAVHAATITVDRAVAPTDAWVVVHLDNHGAPGKRVGLAKIPAGESRNVVVQLDASVMLTEKLLIAIHADRGESDIFEFDMMDGVNSPDQPFFVNGVEVAIPLQLKSATDM